MAELRDVTDTDFESIVLAPGAALVDFWGEACPACRQISPILHALVDEYGDRVAIVKMNAHENVATASRFGIRSMPTVLAFSDGNVVGQLQGARPKSDFEALIEKIL
ncbi:MAG: thioredoxin family protein [Proteobacteria bacterium]|nr:thioredoxin family protein [Pseudomonadota bacterium]